ncbi:hypothetical protein ABPG75_002358 [Micractinium tetrahymenae]
MLGPDTGAAGAPAAIFLIKAQSAREPGEPPPLAAAAADQAPAEQTAADRTADKRVELLFAQLEQQQQLLEAAACRASDAEAKLEAALQAQREAERRLREEGSSGSREERRRSGNARRTQAAQQQQHAGAADAARRLATQQVAAAAAAEHVAAVDAALAQLTGSLAAGLPAAAIAAVSVAASRAQAAASDLARLLQQQAQLEEQLLAMEGPADTGAQQAGGCRRLWIGGVVLRPTEREVQRAVERFGAVDSVRVLLQRRCVFVDFVEAGAAARAMRAMHGKALPQLSGTRALTVQYQKDTAGPAGSSGSSSSSSSSGGAATAGTPAGPKLPLSSRGSMLSAAAPEWQPPAAAQQAAAAGAPALGPALDEWEAAAEAAWAAAGGGWEEWGEGGEEAEPVHLWEPGEPGQADPLLLLPSELTAELEGSAPWSPPAPLPLPLPLGLPGGPGSGASSGAGSGGSSQHEGQQGRGQAAQQGPCRTVVVSNIHPQQRWKPAEFRRKIEDAFSCCGRVEAVDVPKGRPFAFVHFCESEAAANAMEALQGAVVPELAGGPLTLKYSNRERPRALRT